MARESTADARELARCWRQNDVMPAIEAADLPDEAAAYAWQSAFVEALGEPLAGWKVGATNAKSQSLLSLGGPFYGPIPQGAVRPSGSRTSQPRGTLGAEIEIALRLAADLPRRDAPYRPDELRAAIASAHPAIEIIGLRQVWEGMPHGLWAIADLGAHVLFVAGQPDDRLIDHEAERIEARCVVNGQPAGAGNAAAVLGSPLSALAWLADHGPGLCAGQWISTGTITGLAALPAEASVVGDFGDLGSVRLDLH